MCLNINTENPKSVKAETAKSDIICYKVLKAYRTEYTQDNHKIWFETPYTGMPMEFGKTYTDKLKIEKSWDREEETVSIGQGIFHSFTDLESAINEVEEWGEGNIIVECVIPKGTKMYNGFFDYSECYGSKKITIGTKIVYVAKWLIDIEEDVELAKKLVQDYGFEITKLPQDMQDDLPREYFEW